VLVSLKTSLALIQKRASLTGACTSTYEVNAVASSNAAATAAGTARAAQSGVTARVARRGRGSTSAALLRLPDEVFEGRARVSRQAALRCRGSLKLGVGSEGR